MDQPPKEPKEDKAWTGLAIPGGLFVGMGIGFLVGNIPAGLFLGLGAGFLVMLAMRARAGS